jgi:hypothetical protein
VNDLRSNSAMEPSPPSGAAHRDGVGRLDQVIEYSERAYPYDITQELQHETLAMRATRLASSAHAVVSPQSLLLGQ